MRNAIEGNHLKRRAAIIEKKNYLKFILQNVLGIFNYLDIFRIVWNFGNWSGVLPIGKIVNQFSDIF